MDTVQRVFEAIHDLSLAEIDAEIARLDTRLTMLRTVRSMKQIAGLQPDPEWKSAVDLDHEESEPAEHDGTEPNTQPRASHQPRRGANLGPEHVLDPCTNRQRIAAYLYAHGDSTHSNIEIDLGIAQACVYLTKYHHRDFVNNGGGRRNITADLREAVDRLKQFRGEAA